MIVVEYLESIMTNSMNPRIMDKEIIEEPGKRLTDEDKQRIYKSWTFSIIIKTFGKKIAIYI